jgi:group I intron endonuclease
MRYIYCITNLINQKTYLGKRKCNKLPQEDLYMGSGFIIKQAIKKYGLNNFKKEILIYGDFTEDEINEFEKYYISLYRLGGKAEYNVADGGTGGWTNPLNYELWLKHNKESHKGKPLSQQNKENISKAHKGKIISLEHRKQISKTLKGKMAGENHPQFGTHPSKETRNKMSLARIGKKPSNFGVKASQETIDKNRLSKLGTHRFTNGIKNVQVKECPPGFWSGWI